MRNPLVQIAVLSGFLAATTAHSAPPGWWSQGNPPPVTGQTAESHTAATVGQGKWMAQSAFLALEQTLGSGSPVVEDIRNELFKSSENSPTGVFFPERPAAPSTEWLENQRKPLTIGALKALAAPFYKRLSADYLYWLGEQLDRNGLIGGSSYFPTLDSILFPWNPDNDQNSEVNKSIATTGQLKLVFALDFATLPGPADRDGDGLDSAAESSHGTDPDKQDSDGDGLPDGWEVKWGLNPLDPEDAGRDADGDSVSNLQEYRIGSPPTGLFRVVTVPLGTSSNEHLAGVGPDGSVRLVRNGQVLNASGSTLGTGQTNDWISPSLPPAARTRLPLPYGDWQAGGTTPGLADTRYWVAGASKVRAHYHYKKTNSAGTTVLAEDFSFVEKDLATGTNHIETWGAICAALHAAGKLPSATAAVPGNLLVSSQGNRVIFNTGTKCLLLNQNGAFVEELPTANSYYGFSSIEWKLVNNRGEALGIGLPGNKLVYWRVPFLDGGGSLTVREFPFTWEGLPWTLASRLTDDHQVVVEKESTYHLYDLELGIVTPVDLPGFSTVLPESPVDLKETGYLLGSGDEPWIWCQGKATKLASLSIPGANPGDPVRPLSNLGWTGFTPKYLSTDGTISGEAVLPGNIPALVQLVPMVDEDYDGFADDYEMAYADFLHDTYGINVPSTAAAFDVNYDYRGNGTPLAVEFPYLPAPPERLKEGEWTVDFSSAAALQQGLSRTQSPGGTDLPRAKYYKKATYSRHKNTFGPVQDEDGSGNLRITDNYDEELTWAEPTAWTRDPDPFNLRTGPLFVKNWEPSYKINGDWTKNYTYQVPATVASKTKHASYNNLTAHANDTPVTNETTVKTLRAGGAQPPVTNSVPVTVHRGGAQMATSETVPWDDEPTHRLDDYTDPNDHTFTRLTENEDEEGEDEEVEWGVRETWNLEEGEGWEKLAREALTYAQDHAERQGYYSGPGGALDIGGGIGYTTSNPSGAGAKPYGAFQKLKAVFDPGDCDYVLIVTKTLGKLKDGADWISAARGADPQYWITQSTKEYVLLPAGSAKLEREWTTIPDVGFHRVDYGIQFCRIDVVDEYNFRKDEVQVALMSEPGVLTGAGTDNVTLDIDKESRRFYVMLGGNVDDEVSVGIATDSPEAVDFATGTIPNPYDDDETFVTMTRHPQGGITTPSMILVGDAKDDGHPAYNVPDNAPNDRTHIVSLGGKLRVTKLRIGGHEFDLSLERPVKKLGKTFVNVWNLRETAGGSLLAPADVVRQHVQELKEIYFATGIELICSIREVDPPAGVSFSDKFDDAQNPPTAEENAVVDGLVGPVRDQFNVFYLGKFKNNPITLFGYSWNQYSPHKDCCFISDMSTYVWFAGSYVVPHELMHCFDGVSEHSDDKTNILYRTYTLKDHIGGTKRFTENQVFSVHTHRLVIKE